jgi:kynureninase
MSVPAVDARFDDSRACARALDDADPLAPMRRRFHLPRRPDGEPQIYFCGDSLGLQPCTADAAVRHELDRWRDLAVGAHVDGPHPWLSYHETVAGTLAAVVGAEPTEVVAMNSLTVNLHLMLASFYRPTRERFQVLIEDRAFPSDTYAVRSHAQVRGLDPSAAVVTIAPREGEPTLRPDDVHAAIDRAGDRLALVLLPGVQYYTGQAFDIPAITAHGHERGAMVGWDLAHAAGNLVLSLHDWNVDFACWCSYKYLNAGPGAVAGCFVHARHGHDASRARLAGWWGHDKTTRFRMGPDFLPIPGAEGWQLSNPPILALAPLRASLAEFEAAGGMPPLREKSLALTGYLEFLLERRLGSRLDIVTPRDAGQRGCQLSLRVRGLDGRRFLAALERAGVVCDFREPDAVRAAPTPLYNTFDEVYRFADIVSGLVREREPA